MKKVLITGVAGEVGFPLCENLLDLGVDVFGIDIPQERTSERIDMIGRNALFHFTPNKIEEVDWNTMEQTDVIYHFAQTYPASNRFSELKELIASHQRNIKNIVSFAEVNHTKVILLSTIEVYGNTYQQITDDTKPSPTSLYGTIMLAEENFLSEYSRVGDLDYVILRVPFVKKIAHPIEEHCRNIDRTEQEKVSNQNMEFINGHTIEVQDLLHVLIAAGTTNNVKGIVPVPGQTTDNPSYSIKSTKFAELSVHL
ncbi:NAD(P)-dependent oxidoreductase [Alkalihalobacillus sp. AL-G]|uniref:NAD-dependent epimerase/dehydratase family protein n=1 Tax=Alkalihalobacillus sp. AL-G TaxID=2926399 RepID=UPI00272D500B|nr:NAD(P)-dependent oxidoreductase [Alkalihalobacillus sp. AL-G]WLD94901.1 NAD(P)-dependent oxidoreductase [Alkalihalobacillus sp. AL-G]